MALRVGMTHAQMKLGWGYKRLEELKVQIARHASDAYRVTRKDEPENSRHVICIEKSPTPDDLGMLPGEFAYCLRSALDNLAWQLALLRTDTPRRKTSFPIYHTAPDDNYRRAVADIPAGSAEVIDSFQPYHAGARFKNHPLWKLNELCNIDKHRLVAVAFFEIPIQLLGCSEAARQDTDQAIKIAVPLSEKEKVQLNLGFPSMIFGDPIDRVDGNSASSFTIDELGEIYDFIRNEVLPRFEGFFR